MQDIYILCCRLTEDTENIMHPSREGIVELQSNTKLMMKTKPAGERYSPFAFQLKLRLLKVIVELFLISKYFM